MKQIDLEPDQYAERRHGAWRRKSNPKKSGILFAASLVVLGFIWWNAPAFDGAPHILMGVSAMFAFAGGVLAADWLRDIY